MSTASSVRIVVVGDTHDDWNLEEDTKALELLKPDLVLFTGDIGNERVDLVRSIADLKIAKAVILGNHDAWSTQKFSDKLKDPVQLQLECLGEEHVGYSRLDFPSLEMSVVGGRPFSCGGEKLYKDRLLRKRYGVRDMNESAQKIFKAALGTPDGHSIILLAHNGPKGLGSNRNDICGKDWVPDGGDHGDPDLTQAISQLKEKTTCSIPLVVFGHMHKELNWGDDARKMIVVGEDNTIYLNGAVFPRVKKLQNEQRSISRTETNTLTPEYEGSLRAFTLVEFSARRLEKISETWVSVIGDETKVEEEHILFTNGTLKISELSLQ